jgi:hypothetical protein
VIATCDPYIWIEEGRKDYVRYRNVITGRRWEVLGTCIYEGDGNGPCEEGAATGVAGPPGSRLDIPVSPELICELCVDGGTLRFAELESVRHRVVVAALRYDDAAVLALEWERLFPEVHVVAGEYGYGELLARLWRDGVGFCLVEHDIVPWPGALAALWDCAEPWCGYRFMLGHGDLGRGLGCLRFSTELLQTHVGAADELAGIAWHDLDGRVMDLMQSAGLDDYHVHHPPVGHAPVYAVAS